MRDFTDQLDRQLRPLAEGLLRDTRLGHHDLRVLAPLEPTTLRVVVDAAPGATSAPARRERPPSVASGTATRARRRRPLAAAVTSGLVAAAASVAFLTATGAAGLPILETETSDASAAASSPALRDAAIDLRRGHAFSTASGTGFVVASSDGERLCLATPDPADRDSYSGTCAARTSVERDGLTLQTVGDQAIDPGAVNLVAVLLPAGATDPRLEADGGSSTPALQDGVFTAALRGPATLSYDAGGTPHRLAFDGPFDGAVLSCRGETVPTPPPGERASACTDEPRSAGD